MVTRTREKSSKRYNEGTKTHKIQAFVQFLRLHGLATSVAGQSSHSCGVYQTTDIMEYGLPQLEQRDLADGATEHINALGQFARDMADWLQKFASRMHMYTETEGYQKSVQASLAALEKRKINARKSS